jgi:tetratricopeptide (TPR) repeat protein
VPAVDAPLNDAGESESVQLFVELMRRRDASFRLTEANAPFVAAICRRLEGIPLAIELAVARTASMPLADVHARLDQMFQLLRSGHRTAPARHQTLSAMIDWSYESLPGEATTALERLSAFAGGFDLELAQAALVEDGVSEWDVLDVIATLVEKNLVQMDADAVGTRYRFLEPIRQYAAERLAARGASAVATARRRHRDAFRDLAERAYPLLIGPDQLRWMQRLDREVDNFRLALGFSIEDASNDEDGVRLAHHLHRYAARATALVREVRATLTALLARSTPPPALHALALWTVANLTADQSERRAGLERSLAIAEGVGADALVAKVLYSLVGAYITQGDDDPINGLFDQALALSTRAEEPWLTGTLLDLRGMRRATVLGDFDAGREDLMEASRLARDLGDRAGMGSALQNLGVVELARGQFEDARLRLEEAFVEFQAAGMAADAAIAYDLGCAYLRCGQLDEARERFLRALTVDQNAGHEVFLSRDVLAAAFVAARAGLAELATTLHCAARAHSARLGAMFEPYLREWQNTDLADLLRVLGQPRFDSASERGIRLSLAETVTEAASVLGAVS